MTDWIYRGKGAGYEREGGIICMTRCFFCGRENYAMAVHSGHCAWCGKQGKDYESDSSGVRNE